MSETRDDDAYIEACCNVMDKLQREIGNARNDSEKAAALMNARYQIALSLAKVDEFIGSVIGDLVPPIMKIASEARANQKTDWSVGQAMTRLINNMFMIIVIAAAKDSRTIDDIEGMLKQERESAYKAFRALYAQFEDVIGEHPDAVTDRVFVRVLNEEGTKH